MPKTLGYPVMNAWGMYPVTMVLKAEHPDTMEASAAEFGQAQQGRPLLGYQQYVPVGQTTNWEIEDRPKVTIAPAIVYGGLRRIGDKDPIVVAPFEELEERYGIMKTNPWSGINLKPLGIGRGQFLGQVPLRK